MAGRQSRSFARAVAESLKVDKANDAQLADGGAVERRIAVRPDRRDKLLAAVEIVEIAREAILRAVLLQSSNQHRGDHEVHVEILHQSQKSRNDTD